METYISESAAKSSAFFLPQVNANVVIKIERDDFEPDPQKRERQYAKGDGHPDYFLCRFDSHGNICDEEGVVVFPSGSGKYPAKAGDRGYFGEFRENYGEGVRPELPSVHDNVYAYRMKRQLESLLTEDDGDKDDKEEST